MGCSRSTGFFVHCCAGAISFTVGLARAVIEALLLVISFTGFLGTSGLFKDTCLRSGIEKAKLVEGEKLASTMQFWDLMLGVLELWHGCSC